MKQDRILELLAKKMGRSASDAELKELEQLLKEHPQHAHLVSILSSIQSKRLKQPAQNEDLLVKEGWQKLSEKMEPVEHSRAVSVPVVKRIPLKNYALKIAACAGLVAAGLTLWFSLAKDPARRLPLAQMQETVPAGKPEKRILPDGSEVWINAGSSIRYMNAEPGTRDVYLQGEAYFKVHHDAEHPFIVHAGNISVRALGTEFNVSAYPGDEHVETTLMNGKVQVTMEERPDQKIILVPNEKLTVTSKRVIKKDLEVRNEISYEVKPVTVLPRLNEVKEVAWMQDKLVFYNEPFQSLAKKMERRYNVHIIFYDERLKTETLSGVFENESIQKALRVLQMTTPFQYRIRSDSVFLDRP